MLAAARGLADYVTKEQIMEEGKIYPEASELRSVAATVSPPALVQTSPCIDPGILPEPFNPKPLSACHHEGRPSLMIRLGCGALKCVVVLNRVWCCCQVATAVADQAFKQGVARMKRPADLKAYIEHRMYGTLRSRPCMARRHGLPHAVLSL